MVPFVVVVQSIFSPSAVPSEYLYVKASNNTTYVFQQNIQFHPNFPNHSDEKHPTLP